MKRIGSKGRVCRAASGSVRSRSGLAERGRTVSSRSREGGWRVPAKPDRGASVRGRAQLGRRPGRQATNSQLRTAKLYVERLDILLPL